MGPAVRFLSTYEYGLGYTLKRQQKIKYRVNGKQIPKNPLCVYIMQIVFKALCQLLVQCLHGVGELLVFGHFLKMSYFRDVLTDSSSPPLVVGLQTQGSIKSLRFSRALTSEQP